MRNAPKVRINRNTKQHGKAAMPQKGRTVTLPPIPKKYPRAEWQVVAGNNGQNDITERQFLTIAAWAFDRLAKPLPRNMLALTMFQTVCEHEKGGEK